MHSQPGPCFVFTSGNAANLRLQPEHKEVSIVTAFVRSKRVLLCAAAFCCLHLLCGAASGLQLPQCHTLWGVALLQADWEVIKEQH